MDQLSRCSLRLERFEWSGDPVLCPRTPWAATKPPLARPILAMSAYPIGILSLDEEITFVALIPSRSSDPFPVMQQRDPYRVLTIFLPPLFSCFPHEVVFPSGHDPFLGSSTAARGEELFFCSPWALRAGCSRSLPSHACDGVFCKVFSRNLFSVHFSFFVACFVNVSSLYKCLYRFRG